VGPDVLIFAVLTTGAVLISAHAARLLRTMVLHKTIREAISRDSPSVPELLKGVEEQQPGSLNDDRTGIVLIALAAALFLFGLFHGDPDDLRNLGGASLFPAFVGAALLIRYRWARRRDVRP